MFDSDSQMKSSPRLRALSAHAWPSNGIRAPPTEESVFWPHLTRMAGNNSREPTGSAALETREGWAVLIASRAKSVSGMEASSATHGQRVKLTAKAEGSAGALPTEESV